MHVRRNLGYLWHFNLFEIENNDQTSRNSVPCAAIALKSIWQTPQWCPLLAQLPSSALLALYTTPPSHGLVGGD